MNEYHKIQSVFKRDMQDKGKSLLMGEWSLMEFGYLADNLWSFTEKVDGTNIRVMWNGDKITFGGKTDRAMIPAKLVERLRETFNNDGLFRDMFGSKQVCLYGEGYGDGIQKGGKYRADQDFVLFDIKIDGIWLSRGALVDIATRLSIKFVPIVGSGTLHECIKRVSSGSVLSTWGNFKAEGIVARPMYELQTRTGDRIITKIKYKDFSGQ